MKTSKASIQFTCPQCNANFEFDAIVENEFVPCPVCGTECITIKKGNKIVLRNFDVAELFETQIIA
jgi:Zn finger protein HypA/HybF involved in hydrogenase expression